MTYRLLDRSTRLGRRLKTTYRPVGIALNIGTGGIDRDGWINVDETKPGDVLAYVPPLPFRSDSVDEVYLGHVLEHLHRDDGLRMLAECHRVLRPGGRLTAVVPDSKILFGAYLLDALNNDDLNDLYVYSYVQDSHHRWCYDARSLRALMESAGFTIDRRVNRLTEPRLVDSAWWQVGYAATKRR